MLPGLSRLSNMAVDSHPLLNPMTGCSDPCARAQNSDPDFDNVNHTRNRYGPSIPNLRPLFGALFSTAATNLSRADLRRDQMTLYPCHGGELCNMRMSRYSLDSLFEKEALGFAHLDLEYKEIEVRRRVVCRPAMATHAHA